MKKIRYVVLAFSLLLIVAECSGEKAQTMSSNDVKKKESESAGKNKLDREEKIALDFYEKLVNGSAKEQEGFINENVHSEGIEYFEGIKDLSQTPEDNQNPKVIESTKTTFNDGEEGKLVLLNVENAKKDVRETILAFAKEKKEYKLLYSITSENEGEALETFNSLRSDFKAKVPSEMAKRKEAEAAQVANIEVSDQALYSWKDSVNSIWVNYNAEIKNTGDAPAKIGSIQVNFVDVNDSVIGTFDMIVPVPNILLPGETAYIGETTLAQAADSPDSIVDATVNIDFNKTTEDPSLLETENVNIKEVKNGFGGPYVVTGIVKNPYELQMDDIRLASGLYDADGKLIAILKETLQVNLNPDGTAGFEMSYPQLSKEIQGKVADVKVKAYNWSW